MNENNMSIKAAIVLPIGPRLASTVLISPNLEKSFPLIIRPITAKNYNKSIVRNNLNILSTWCTIGADVENGKFAMLGARMGCFYTVLQPDNEFFKIRDLDEMENYFNEVNADNIDEELKLFGNSLRQQLDIPIAEYSEEDSNFYRFVMPAHINRGVQDREYQ